MSISLENIVLYTDVAANIAILFWAVRAFFNEKSQDDAADAEKKLAERRLWEEIQNGIDNEK